MSKFTKLFGIVVVLAMLIGVMPMASATPAAGAVSTLNWGNLTMPNSAGLTNMQANTDYNYLAIGPDNSTLWAVGVSGATWRLRYTPAGGGATWRTPAGLPMLLTRPLGKVVIAPDDKNIIAVVASSAAGFRDEVWVSTDGGATWTNSGFAVTTIASEYIADLQWSPSYSVGGGQGRDLGVVTYDTAGTFGRVWMYQMKTTGFAGGWVDVSTNATGPINGTRDFLAIDFPAGYGGDFSFLVLSQLGATVVLDMALRNPNASATPYVIWNAGAFVGYPSVVATAVAVTGDIATPADFAGQVARQQRAWVCFDDNNVAIGVNANDVYRIDGARPAVKLNAGNRPYNLAYSGSFTTGKLLVTFVEGISATATTTILRSLNAQSNSPTWDPPFKAATGNAVGPEGRAWVVWAPDGKTAHAVTSTNAVAATTPALFIVPGAWNSVANDESAYCKSLDDGDSWNEVQFVDTTVSRFTSFAVSADGTQCYIASVSAVAPNFDSIWRTSSASGATSFAGNYERVATFLSSVNIVQVKIAKDKADGSVVFWGDISAGAAANRIQRSIDKGNTWNACGSVTTGNLADFVATDMNTLYTLGQNNGKVAKGTATGFSWSWGAEVPTLMTTGYMIDGMGQNIIVTSTYPTVSTDGGVTWARNLATAPNNTAGNAIVALDADFANNKYYYTSWTGTAAAPAVGAAGPAVTRTKAPSSAYELLDTGGAFASQNDTVYMGIGASPIPGNFYALRSLSNTAIAANIAAAPAAPVVALPFTGVMRTIEGLFVMPKPGVTTDRLNTGTITNWTNGGWTGAATMCAPNNIVVAKDSRVFIGFIDYDANTAAAAAAAPGVGVIRGFMDTMTTDKSKTTPAGKATVDVAFNGFNVPYTFKWTVVGASTGYDVQVGQTSDFADASVINLANNVPANPTDPTTVIPTNSMMAGGTYYGRVRVASVEGGQLIKSPWSETVTFTIKAGVPVAQTSTGVQAASPAAGAQNVNITGVGFAWTALQGATQFKFVLASDATLTKTLVSTTVTGTAYMYDGKLTNDTAYFWQVTPVGGDASAVFSFTTKAAAVAPPAATAAPAPIVIPAPVVNVPPASTATPVWVWAVIGIGAVLVIVTLVLIFRTRRV